MNPESHDESLLEGNVAALVKAASSPPRMAPAVRERVLGKLLVAQQVRHTALQQAAAVLPTARGWRSSLPQSRAGRFGLAASAAGFALLVGFLLTRPAQTSSEIAYENAGPGPRVVTLRDGSVVTLDVGAAIIERAPRSVELVRGQAVFDVIHVASDEVGGAVEAASFDVQTVAGRAIASGSRFMVKASVKSAEIAVAKGMVQVFGERGARAEVHAGEQSTLSGDVPPEAKPAPRVSHLFDFARKPEADGVPGAPTGKGTLVGRDPRWQKEAPLDLRDFSIDVHVEGGFARTTIDQTFWNPRPRQLEGVYSFPMPKGAAISRLAMYVDGTLMESAIVERSRGRDIYEGIVEQRRDPALLEWMSGNTFRMRIFPIPGRTDKRIFMSYTQPLEHLYGSDRLVVPIPSVDQVASHAKFSVKVVDGARYEISSPSHKVEVTDDGANRLITFEQNEARLGQDLVVSLREKSDDGEEAVEAPSARAFDQGAHHYILARTSPDLRALAPAAKSRASRRIAVVFDVSASRSQEAIAAQARFVDGLIDAFDETDEVTFVTVGHEARVMPGGLVAARGIKREDVARFLSASGEGVGDTRLDLGLVAAGAALGDEERDRQVIYVGDGFFVGQGVAPSKGSEAELLTRSLAGRARFIGVGIGDSIDRGTLDAIANATNGMAIEVGEGEDMAHRAFDLVATTYTPCLGGLKAELLDAAGRPVEGALSAVTASRVCDGERVEVVLRAPRGSAASKVRVRGRVRASSPSIDGEPWETTIDVADARGGAGFLPRVFAERRVAALLADAPPNAGQAESPNSKEIVSLARQYFLVTPFTSLLVLENDAMYKEFDVEKKKPQGWALYEAPSTVKVAYEPIGSGAISDAGDWDVLERSPTQLFYARQSQFEAQLGLGAVGFGTGGGGRGQMLRMDASGTGQGFGSGSGRLGGGHREKPAQDAPVARFRQATTDSLREASNYRSMLTRSLPLDQSIAGLLPLATASEVARLAQGEDARMTWHGGSASDAVDGGADWLEQAFQGGQLSAFQYESDPRLSDLTEFMPSMFGLAVDRRADYLRAVSDGASARDSAALDLLERAQGKMAGSFELASGRRVTIHDDGSVSETNTLALGSSELVTASSTGLVHAYPDLGLRTKRSAGPELVWWLAEEAPLTPPLVSWTEGLRVDLLAPNTVRIRAPEQAKGSDVVLPDLELTFDDALRLVKVVQVMGSERETVTIAADKSDWLVTRAGQTKRWKQRKANGREQGSYVDIVMPLANPNRWLDRIKEPGFRSDNGFARRQLLASYAAMGDTAAMSRELDALAAEIGKLERGDIVLASRAMAGSSESMSLVTRLPPNDSVRRYLEATAASGAARESAFASLADKSKGSLVGALSSYRRLLALIGRGSANDDVEKGMRSLVTDYPWARFFHYAAARQAHDRLGWQEAKRITRVWEVLSTDEALRPIADKQIAILQRSSQGDSEQGARRAVRALDAAFERGYAFDLDWQLRSAITNARGQIGMDLLLSKWRGKIQKQGSAKQVLSFVRANIDPYNRANSPDVSGVLRRLSDVEVDESTRLSITAMLLASGQLPEAKRVLYPALTSSARPVAIELGAMVAERSGDLEVAAALLDRLLRETEGESIDMTFVRGWYSRLIDLSLRKARTDTELDIATDDVLAIAARWRREDAANPAIDEVCAVALFRVGREEDGRRHLSSIVERRPAEGGSWGRVGELLQVQGDVDGAMASFGRAALVEPTNPTWTLRHAQALLSRNDTNDEANAKALLQVIATRQEKEPYQARYSNIVSDANRLAAGLGQKDPSSLP